MARCDEGYLCQVCGREVERLRDSDLYLRYVLGDVAAEQLHVAPERHLRCNPALSQFIVHPRFTPPCVAPEPFDKSTLDAEFVRQRESEVTAAFERLLRLQQKRSDQSILDYPLAAADPVESKADDAGT